MMTSRKNITPSLILAAIVLVQMPGCAKRQVYPGERKPDDQVAYITARPTLLSSMVVKVDGKEMGPLSQYYLPPGVGDAWFAGPRKGVSVLPANHTVAIRVTKYGWIQAGRSICATVRFLSRAGERYEIVMGRDVVQIVDDETREVVEDASLVDCPPLSPQEYARTSTEENPAGS